VGPPGVQVRMYIRGFRLPLFPAQAGTQRKDGIRLRAWVRRISKSFYSSARLTLLGETLAIRFGIEGDRGTCHKIPKHNIHILMNILNFTP
jgi:hypothetical protein